MKKLLVIAALALALPCSATSLIGLFADEYGEQCWSDITPYVEVELYLLAFLDSDDFNGGLTAAEFKLKNWPVGPSGHVEEIWRSTLLIGDLESDFSIAFYEAQPGPIVVLGRLKFTMFAEDWIEEGLQITVVNGNDCDCLVMVNEIFDIVEAGGLQFTFNCDGDCSCLPGNTPIQSSWSRVKSLY
jgi:hypothetical protein